jgi:hypothetical protein
MANRKTNRKNRNRTANRNRNNRKGSRKNRCMYGGDPASVNDTSMAMSQRDSFAQGEQFAGIHREQHGGAETYLSPAPVIVTNTAPAQTGGAGIQLVGGGYGGYPDSVVGSTLPSDMTASARIGPLNQAIAAIQGMKDQAGGRRRSNRNRMMYRKNRNNRKTNRKNRSNRNNRNRKNRSNRRNRRQMGGAMSLLAPAPVVTNSAMLLPPGLEKQAQLNYEWSLASDPNSFAPKQ